MTIQDIFKTTHFINSITQLVGSRGVSLEVGSDFFSLEQALKAQTERNSLAPKFDPKRNHLNDVSAFWILGKNSKGEIIHTQAVRLIELHGQTLASFLDKRFLEFIPSGHDIIESKSHYTSAPGSRSIEGKVCYHGELWLKGGNNGYRGAGMTAVLARFAMLLALLKWSPDYIFGFMFPIAACKGLAAREGYMHTEANSLSWAIEGREERLEEWTVWMDQQDIRHLLTIQPHILFEQLERVHKGSRKKVAA